MGKDMRKVKAYNNNMFYILSGNAADTLSELFGITHAGGKGTFSGFRISYIWTTSIWL